MGPVRATSNFGKATASAMFFCAIFGGCTEQAVNAGERSTVVSKMAPASRPTVEPLTVEELAKLAGEPCDTPLDGNHCTSDESDFELTPDCAVHGYYAAVKNPDGAAMLSKVPPQNNIVRSTISFGQLVCVQAVARIKNYPSYAFVTAISSVNPSVCTSCVGFGRRKIVWSVPHEDGSCKEVTPGRFEGGCAIGWVDGDDLTFLGNSK